MIDATEVEVCPSCGCPPGDRSRGSDYRELRTCPHCEGQKCAMCDMGDDVECPSCSANDE